LTNEYFIDSTIQGKKVAYREMKSDVGWSCIEMIWQLKSLQ